MAAKASSFCSHSLSLAIMAIVVPSGEILAISGGASPGVAIANRLIGGSVGARSCQTAAPAAAAATIAVVRTVNCETRLAGAMASAGAMGSNTGCMRG